MAPDTVTAALAKTTHPTPVLPDDQDQTPPADCGMIALTVPEIQRLLPALLSGPGPCRTEMAAALSWSTWRRRHQARTRWYHYRRRYALIT